MPVLGELALEVWNSDTLFGENIRFPQISNCVSSVFVIYIVSVHFLPLDSVLGFLLL